MLSIARSRNMVEAHLKTMRLFRKWCRFMPWIINWQGLRKFNTPEKAKL
jgi:hypothetical protein